MAKTTSAIMLAKACLAALVILVVQEAWAGQLPPPSKKEKTSHLNDIAIAPKESKKLPQGGITDLRITLIQYTNHVCEKCATIWRTHVTQCAAWLESGSGNCTKVHQAIQTADEKQISGAMECLRSNVSEKAAECLRAHDGHVPDLILLKKDKRVPKGRWLDATEERTNIIRDGMDAPIGWRTIQGEWFQKLRRPSMTYPERSADEL